MINETELEEKLVRLGFDIVQPERLTMEQTIDIFASADIVVGPSGADMFNTVFCEPGTTIIDIGSESHWLHGHSCLFSSCAHPYVIFEARSVETDARAVHKSFSVNIEALLDRISTLR
jgi:capsular polysaccharide biosynthesis protein